jgi:hypothetical protein
MQFEWSDDRAVKTTQMVQQISAGFLPFAARPRSLVCSAVAMNTAIFGGESLDFVGMQAALSAWGRH